MEKFNGTNFDPWKLKMDDYDYDDESNKYSQEDD
jgi:hypothetical protein